MFWSRKRKNDANLDADLGPRVHALERRIGELAERLLEEEQKAFAFRGRVYAYLGKKGIKLKQEDENTDDFDWRTAPLDDPRLTKSQVKLRLGVHTASGVARRLKEST